LCLGIRGGSVAGVADARGIQGDSVAVLIAWVAIADSVTVVVMPLTLSGSAGLGEALAGDAAIVAIGAALLLLVPQPGRARAHRRGGELFVPVGNYRPSVEKLYRRLARQEITDRLDAATASIGASYKGLSIRSQSTRWASCSAKGAMSFNWRLLLAPEPVLDYVVWHEVCHLDIRDHSPRFWALVESRCPGWRTQRDWLHRYGATLVL